MNKWKICEKGVLEITVCEGSGGGVFIRYSNIDITYPWCVYEWSDGCEPQFQDKFNNVKSAIEYSERLT